MQSGDGGGPRILIIGGEAVGKTTFARRLAARLSVPIHDLDTIAWRAPEHPDVDLSGEFEPDIQSRDTLVQRELPDRLARVDAICGTPAWIVEGIFLGWTARLFEDAETIVWLDHVSYPAILRRVVARNLRSARHAAQGRRAPIGTYLRATRNALAVIRRATRYRFGGVPSAAAGDAYHRITRRAVQRALAPYSGKVVHIRAPADADTYLASRGAGGRRPQDGARLRSKARGSDDPAGT